MQTKVSITSLRMYSCYQRAINQPWNQSFWHSNGWRKIIWPHGYQDSISIMALEICSCEQTPTFNYKCNGNLVAVMWKKFKHNLSLDNELSLTVIIHVR